MRWYDDKADKPPWLKALAVRRLLGPREGWRYIVQAVMLSIEQYAEAALGNRDFFFEQAAELGRLSHDRGMGAQNPAVYLIRKAVLC
ncbi:MAG: hypothetical protein ACJ8EL_19015 [Rhizomicrobium sp.]|jgi:hypothetical protein